MIDPNFVKFDLDAVLSNIKFIINQSQVTKIKCN